MQSYLKSYFFGPRRELTVVEFLLGKRDLCLHLARYFRDEGRTRESQREVRTAWSLHRHAMAATDGRNRPLGGAAVQHPRPDPQRERRHLLRLGGKQASDRR